VANVAIALRAYLIGQSSLSDQISTRMYPDALPQSSTLPAVSYRKISGVHDHYVEGYSGVCTARITFDCYAATRSSAEAVADAIAELMNGLRGTYSSVDILDVQYDSGPEYYEESPQDGSDEHRYVTTMDFLINYRE
jgi:hypothetical protein